MSDDRERESADPNMKLARACVLSAAAISAAVVCEAQRFVRNPMAQRGFWIQTRACLIRRSD
eukprot:12855890-Heterocapsa_arctica.AAC.1